jgi:hypothetical protein
VSGNSGARGTGGPGRDQEAGGYSAPDIISGQIEDEVGRACRMRGK